MRDIEGFAKPFLIALIQGGDCLISPFVQFTISALLCLIAMRLEFLSGDMRAMKRDDYDWLRRHRHPGQDWKIWIAWFEGEGTHEHSSRSYSLQVVSEPTDIGGPKYCNMQVTTLVLGRLCAHLIYAPDLPVPESEYEGVHLTRIWPPSRFQIDTSGMIGLSDLDVLWLHETYARNAPSLEPLPQAGAQGRPGH
jgi:hypothetical protein